MVLTEIHKKEFADILSSCDPKHLRKTIQFLYFSLTTDKNNKNLLPENFDEISSDIFHLLEFIERLEEISSAK
jgi:hypothetical protein